MKELFRERDSTRVGYYQSILEAEGIPTHVRNRDLVSMASDIPIPEFFPALCVVNEEDYEEALAILRDYTQGSDGEAVDGGNDADATAVIPFETKGIVFAGVAVIFGILFLSALMGFLLNIGSIADPEPPVGILVSAGIVMAVSVFAVIKVGRNYRATQQRAAIEGRA